MNYQFQLKNIKQQLGNIDTQFNLLMNQIQDMTSSSVYNMAIQILNIGINMLNIGIQIPNLGNGVFNYSLQIENIGIQIQNIGNQIKNNMNNNNKIPNNNIMMPGKNNNDEECIKGFKMGDKEANEEEYDNSPKINIIFKTTQGVTHKIVCNYGTTIDEVLKKYLNTVNKPELINQNKLCFLFNAAQLKFGDKTKVEDYFKGILNPKVVVNDVNHLIR